MLSKPPQAYRLPKTDQYQYRSERQSRSKHFRIDRRLKGISITSNSTIHLPYSEQQERILLYQKNKFFFGIVYKLFIQTNFKLCILMFDFSCFRSTISSSSKFSFVSGIYSIDICCRQISRLQFCLIFLLLSQEQLENHISH